MPQFNYAQKFTELFTPPSAEYKTDFVAMTTFSLSLRFLLILPILISRGEEPDAVFPTSINSAIKDGKYQDAVKKFHIWYDGNTKAGADNQLFIKSRRGKIAQSMLNSNCTPVKPDSGLFHPKIMVFQFSNNENQKLFRVHISSRNLTMSHYQEAGVTFEQTNRGTKLEKIANFFSLPQLDKVPIDWDKFSNANFCIKCSKITNGILQPCKIKNFSVHFGGLDKIGGEPGCLYNLINTDCNKNYPYMRITSMNPDTTLFGTTNVQYICNFKDLYEDPNNSNQWNYSWKNRIGWYLCKHNEGTNHKIPKMPIPLHIKQYILYNAEHKDKDIIVWIGSANCSRNGLCGNNVEVMVRYKDSSAEDKFPCGNPNKNRLINGGADYCQEDTVTNPEISAVNDEDSFINVKVESAEYFKNEEKLQITITNNETVGISAFLPGKETSEKSINLTSKNQLITFEGIDAKNFSNVLMVKKAGSETVYSITLPIEWNGIPMKDLIKGLPLEPIESVRELVPTIKGNMNPLDEAFERLLKHKLIQPPDKLKDILKAVQNQINKRREECESYITAYGKLPPEPDLEDIDEEDYDEEETKYKSVLSTYRLCGDINTLEEMIKELKKEMNNNEPDKAAGNH